MYKDTEFIILFKLKGLLSKHPDAKQREIAEKCLISLGCVNSILRRFEQRGWITVKRITSRQTTYRLTNKGITAGTKFIRKLTD